jgi:hypothetical protein
LRAPVREVVECDVRKIRAGGGERGELPIREGVDLLARLAILAPRAGEPEPEGAVDPRFGEFAAVPGLETGNSPSALGLIVAAPIPFPTVVPVRTGTIGGLVVIASGPSRMDPRKVAEELLLLRLWFGDRAHFSTRPPGLGKGRWWIDAVRKLIGSLAGS